MMKILKINPQKFKKEEVNLLISFLKRSKVIIFPTDTVYGLICDATNKKAVEKIFKIKRRPKNKPLPIFVKDIKMAKKFARISKEQKNFLKSVWPGKVTAVLKRKKNKIKLYGADSKTIALRIPNYKLVNILLKKLNKPLVGTSANISGKPASGRLKEILKQFGNKKYQPDLAINGGVLPGKPSKVIDLTKIPYKILRE